MNMFYTIFWFIMLYFYSGNILVTSTQNNNLRDILTELSEYVYNFFK